MENENKRIIEIDGIKMEVDLRQAKTIDHYKVGDRVKILVAKYGNDYKSYPGVIIGFDDFENMPTIVVAYLQIDYSDAAIQFAYINSNEENKKKYEITPFDKYDLLYDKSDVLNKMDSEIAKKQQELDDLNLKKKYFLNHFNKYFAEIEEESAVKV